LDFVVSSGAIPLARQVARHLDAAFYILDEASDTGRVVIIHDDGTRDILDFAAYRGPDIEADLRARDFTFNALALDLTTLSLLDPLRGVSDLREKRIRACSSQSFTQDPVRILRAVRQAAALGFNIQPETRQMMKAAVSLLDQVSSERKRDELFKILEGPRPATALKALDILGVLPYLLPELPALKGVTQSPPHVHDVWAHTMRVLDYLEGILSVLAPGYSAENTNDLLTGLLTLRLGRYRQQFAAHFAEPLNANRSPRALLFLAALYHDIAKPLTRTVEPGGRIRFLGHDERGAEMAAGRARALTLSNDEVARLQTIIRHHMRLHAFSDRLLEDKAEPSRKAI
ncbi:MAG: HD domain-containing protein, partial [Anaerolineales bacterium]